MPNPIPGPIPLATTTQQGQVSIAAQAFGGVKTFEEGAVTSVYDIRNPLYAGGAIPVANATDPSLAVHDATDAIYAAMAAWTNIGTGAMFQKGVIMCGKITMSRMGIMGSLRRSFLSRLSLDWVTEPPLVTL